MRPNPTTLAVLPLFPGRQFLLHNHFDKKFSKLDVPIQELGSLFVCAIAIAVIKLSYFGLQFKVPKLPLVLRGHYYIV